MGLGQAGTIRDQFSSILGNRRGVTHALHGPHPVAAWEDMVAKSGLEDAVRALRPEGVWLLEKPELIAAVGKDILDAAYEDGRPLMLQWLRILSLRPGLMEQIISVRMRDSSQAVLHMLAPGYISVDEDDLYRSLAPLLCTDAPLLDDDGRDDYRMLKRGRWNQVSNIDPEDLGEQPTICPSCATHAHEYPETREDDYLDPWPYDVLEGDLREWRRRGQVAITQQLTQEADLPALKQIVTDYLYDSAKMWAATRLTAYPRELTISALELGIPKDSSLYDQHHEIQAIAKEIAALDLSRETWLEMLAALDLPTGIWPMATMAHQESKDIATDWAGKLLSLRK